MMLIVNYALKATRVCVELAAKWWRRPCVVLSGSCICFVNASGHLTYDSWRTYLTKPEASVFKLWVSVTHMGDTPLPLLLHQKWLLSLLAVPAIFLVSNPDSFHCVWWVVQNLEFLVQWFWVRVLHPLLLAFSALFTFLKLGLFTPLLHVSVRLFNKYGVTAYYACFRHWGIALRVVVPSRSARLGGGSADCASLWGMSSRLPHAVVSSLGLPIMSLMGTALPFQHMANSRLLRRRFK